MNNNTASLPTDTKRKNMETIIKKEMQKINTSLNFVNNTKYKNSAPLVTQNSKLIFADTPRGLLKLFFDEVCGLRSETLSCFEGSFALKKWLI